MTVIHDAAVEVARFVRYATLRFWNGHCPQAAASLTYTSLLALVPLMTITVGILSAFPAFESVRQGVQTVIFDTLVPQVGHAVLDNLESFVDRAESLTAIGVIALLATAILLLATIEGAFNDIWRVTDSRPLYVRVLSFWAVLTMTPLLLAASFSVTTQVISTTTIQEHAPVWRYALGMMPLLFEFITFSLLYKIIPNRSVRMRDAAVGGALAAVLFELSKAGFAVYITEFPTYQTIYGALSTIPIFLVWLYLTWSVVLVGAVTAAALSDWRGIRWMGGSDGALDARRSLFLAVMILRDLAAASREGRSLRRVDIGRRVDGGWTVIGGTLDRLKAACFIARTADDGWVVSRDLRHATLHDLAVSLGLDFRPEGLDDPPATADPLAVRLDALMARADALQQDVFGLPLATLFEEEGEPGQVARFPIDGRA